MSFGHWLSLAKMLIFYGSLKHAQLKQDQKHPQVYSKTSIAVFDSTINSYAKKLQQNNIKALVKGEEGQKCHFFVLRQALWYAEKALPLIS